MIIDLAYPISNIIEALLAGRVVGEDDSLRAPIVRLGDRPEPLLTSRVPNLHFHILPVQLNCIYLEINAWKNE